MDTRRSILLAALVAFVIRAAIGLALPVAPAWDGVVYERAASAIAAGEGYTRRALSPHGSDAPTAFYPVGWPAALALWRGLGMPRALDPLLQALLGALAVPLAALFAGRLAGRRAAAWGAWLVAVWPGGALGSASWMSEPLFTLLLAGAVALAVRRSATALVASAVLFALAAYVRPTALAIAPLVLAAAVWSPGASRPIRLARMAGAAALALAVALVILSPWLARNRAALGGAALSTNGGANLLVGTASSRFLHVPRAIDCRADGELARDRCRRERALERIAADPLTWLARVPLKLAHTFGYESSAAVQLARALGVREPLRAPLVWIGVAVSSAYWLALLALAIRGFARSRARARLLALASCLAIALVHSVYFGGDRYHAPLVPLVAALAAAALARRPRQALRADCRDRRAIAHR